MSETGWTKGPYSFEQEMRGDGAPLPEYTISSDAVTLGDEPLVIASVYAGKKTAALIAAAPDLAEAAGITVDAIAQEYHIPADADDEWIYDTLGSALSDAYFRARAALARAKGGS